MLYQISCPMPGFPDSLQGKSKNNKTKKCKLDKSSKDDLDPSSLLGAMMRQDESVYVCQPAMEPRMSFHSSLFSEQGETSTFSSSEENKNWNPVQNGLTAVSKLEPLSFDPLLSTLDSLSLENEESCSNSELFSALENLGLNAEDLELLLLDERMIQVEMEPEYIPSLNDLLTNNEILSYVQDSLENRIEDSTDAQNPAVALSSVEPPEPCTASKSASQITSSITDPHVPFWPQKQKTPIVHLSQHMQQHLNGQLVFHKTESWIQAPVPQVSTTGSETTTFTQHDTLLVNSVPAVQNGHWVPEQANLNSQLGDKIAGTSKAQSQQWQHNQLLDPFQYKQKTAVGSDTPPNGVYSDTQWHGYNFTDQLVTNGPCFPNGHMAHTKTVGTHIDYNITDNSGVEFTMNISTAGDVGQFQEAMASSSSYQQGYQNQQPKDAPTYYASYTKQNSSLEHILGLAPSSNFSSLTDYSSELTHDTTQSKVRIKEGYSCAMWFNQIVQAPGSTTHITAKPYPQPQVHPQILISNGKVLSITVVNPLSLNTDW